MKLFNWGDSAELSRPRIPSLCLSVHSIIPCAQAQCGSETRSVILAQEPREGAEVILDSTPLCLVQLMPEKGPKTLGLSDTIAVPL